MNREDIKVGQVYSWRNTPESKFKIANIDGGLITWFSYQKYKIVSYRYPLNRLLRCMNEGTAYLVEDENQKPTYKMDRFKFV